MRIEVLGPLRAVGDDGSEIPVGGRQHRLVLAVLAATGGRGADDDVLVEAVWGHGVAQPTPVGLRVLVHGLRRALGATSIRRVNRRYELVAAVDTDEFEAYVRRAEALADAGSPVPARDTFRAALRLWRGPAYAGLAAGEPVRTEADRLDDLRLRAHERCYELELELGSGPDPDAGLAALAAAHPLRERLQAALMRALVRADRRAEALAVYERTRRLLADELGVDPGDRLRDLYTEVLRGPVRTAPVGTLERPFQVPAGPSHFQARTAELAALDAVCDDTLDGRRPTAVVTVSGAGGMGKTALVAHWSHQRAARFGDGQLYLDLDAHPEPGSALGRALIDLGVPPDELPGPTADRSARLRSIMATRSLLVVLDNVTSAAQARPFLPGSHTSVLVVNSRDRLDGLVARDGAALLPVGPMPPAASLALLRAVGGLPPGRADDNLRTLADLCDGLPLALRIVGAHLRLDASPADLIKDLRDERTRVERLRTADGDAAVHPTIAVSYRRLDDTARRLLRWLGRTPGEPVPVAALAALAGVDVDAARAAAVALARANLALLSDGRGGARVAVHQLIRMFAHGQSEREDDAGTLRAGERRLLAWYAHAVSRADRRLRPTAHRVEQPREAPPAGLPALPDVAAAVDFLDAEADMIAALLGRIGPDQPDLTWPIIANLRGWLQRRAPRSAWIALASQGIAAAAAVGAVTGEATLHVSLGVAHSLLLERASAQAAYERAVDLYARAGDVAGQVDAYASLGAMLTESGALAEALDPLERARTLNAGLDDPDLTCKVQINLGLRHRRAGDLGPALHAYEVALAAADRSADRDWLAASVHTNIGRLRFVRGEHDRAEHHYRQAIDLARRSGDRMREAWSLHGVSDVLAARGDRAGAADAMRDAIGLLEPLGDRRLPEMRDILAGLEQNDPTKIQHPSRTICP
ncbi:BTAD domain-containing putative transcriptional regulator [Micromonospora costi]|uniref:AfsR/SARP family transcriptional regulator n=1 Tax=Micromonospora costi TaxID=1530042 RepID=UPI0033C3DC9A